MPLARSPLAAPRRAPQRGAAAQRWVALAWQVCHGAPPNLRLLLPSLEETLARDAKSIAPHEWEMDTAGEIRKTHVGLVNQARLPPPRRPPAPPRVPVQRPP